MGGQSSTDACPRGESCAGAATGAILGGAPCCGTAHAGFLGARLEALCLCTHMCLCALGIAEVVKRQGTNLPLVDDFSLNLSECCAFALVMCVSRLEIGSIAQL